MNIYQRELRAHIKSLLIWCGGMIFLVIGGMAKYSAGAASGPGSMNALMKEMPVSLQNLFGVGVFDLSSALEFFAVMNIYILLLMGIHAVMLGSQIIAKEERDRTAEFLLVKPVSRSQILTAKLLAALTILALFWLVTVGSSYAILANYAKPPEFQDGLMKLMAAAGAVQLLFVSLGAFFAGVLKRSKKSTAAGTAVLLAMFLFSVTADILKEADALKYFSFFKYYDAKDILKRGYSPVYPVLSAVLIIAMIWGAYHTYKRRDMKI
jgi:ABC-2 type transport system permease protein